MIDNANRPPESSDEGRIETGTAAAYVETVDAQNAHSLENPPAETGGEAIPAPEGADGDSAVSREHEDDDLIDGVVADEVASAASEVNDGATGAPDTGGETAVEVENDRQSGGRSAAAAATGGAAVAVSVLGFGHDRAASAADVHPPTPEPAATDAKPAAETPAADAASAEASADEPPADPEPKPETYEGLLKELYDRMQERERFTEDTDPAERQRVEDAIADVTARARAVDPYHQPMEEAAAPGQEVSADLVAEAVTTGLQVAKPNLPGAVILPAAEVHLRTADPVAIPHEAIVLTGGGDGSGAATVPVSAEYPVSGGVATEGPEAAATGTASGPEPDQTVATGDADPVDPAGAEGDLTTKSERAAQAGEASSREDSGGGPAASGPASPPSGSSGPSGTESRGGQTTEPRPVDEFDALMHALSALQAARDRLDPRDLAGRLDNHRAIEAATARLRALAPDRQESQGDAPGATDGVTIPSEGVPLEGPDDGDGGDPPDGTDAGSTGGEAGRRPDEGAPEPSPRERLDALVGDLEQGVAQLQRLLAAYDAIPRGEPSRAADREAAYMALKSVQARIEETRARIAHERTGQFDEGLASLYVDLTERDSLMAAAETNDILTDEDNADERNAQAAVYQYQIRAVNQRIDEAKERLGELRESDNRDMMAVKMGELYDLLCIRADDQGAPGGDGDWLRVEVDTRIEDKRAEIMELSARLYPQIPETAASQPLRAVEMVPAELWGLHPYELEQVREAMIESRDRQYPDRDGDEWQAAGARPYDAYINHIDMLLAQRDELLGTAEAATRLGYRVMNLADQARGAMRAGGRLIRERLNQRPGARDGLGFDDLRGAVQDYAEGRRQHRQAVAERDRERVAEMTAIDRIIIAYAEGNGTQSERPRPGAVPRGYGGGNARFRWTRQEIRAAQHWGRRPGGAGAAVRAAGGAMRAVGAHAEAVTELRRVQRDVARARRQLSEVSVIDRIAAAIPIIGGILAPRAAELQAELDLARARRYEAARVAYPWLPRIVSLVM
jgi:hypothetical protein